MTVIVIVRVLISVLASYLFIDNPATLDPLLVATDQFSPAAMKEKLIFPLLS